MDILLAEPTLPSGEQQNRIVTAEIRRVGEPKERVLEFIASDETVDRYQDIVTTEGWEITAYKKNPVFLYGHDHGGLPIGRSIKTFVGEHPNKKSKEALIHHVKFAEKGVHYDEWPITQPTPETVYRLYTSEPRMLNAVSVGFLPLAYEPIMEKDGDKERWTGGFKFTKQELLELSAVTVPANPGALLVNGFDATGLRQADVVWLASQCERVLTSLKGTPDENKELVEQWSAAIAKVRTLRTEPRITMVVPEIPKAADETLTAEEVTAAVVASATEKQDPQPAEVAKELAVSEVAAATAEGVIAEPAQVVKEKKLSKTHKERLQEIISMCQEMLDGEEGEEEEDAAPVPEVRAKPKETNTNPEAVKELADRMDAALSKLGVAGVTVSADTKGAPTASQEANPYALLLDASQSAQELLAALDK